MITMLAQVGRSALIPLLLCVACSPAHKPRPDSKPTEVKQEGSRSLSQRLHAGEACVFKGTTLVPLDGRIWDWELSIKMVKGLYRARIHWSLRGAQPPVWGISANGREAWRRDGRIGIRVEKPLGHRPCRHLDDDFVLVLKGESVRAEGAWGVLEPGG